MNIYSIQPTSYRRAVSAASSSSDTGEDQKGTTIRTVSGQKKTIAKKTWQDDEEATIVVYA